jgi:hypothetical protein
VILIGRLRFTPSQAIEAYQKLVPVIPTQAAKSDEERKRNTEKFMAEFIKVLKTAGFDENTPMLDEDGAKMSVIIFGLCFMCIDRSKLASSAPPIPLTFQSFIPYALIVPEVHRLLHAPS